MDGQRIRIDGSTEDQDRWIDRGSGSMDAWRWLEIAGEMEGKGSASEGGRDTESGALVREGGILRGER
eukprot:292008-Chlamydomonas_euryale.AAC.1